MARLLKDRFVDAQPSTPAWRPTLNLQQLAIFGVVAEHQGIRAAARRLGVTQPAVTYAMRELERNVGGPLLRRSSTGVELTALGIALQRRARLLLAETQRAEDEIQQLRDGAGGSICVAFSSGAALEVLVPTLNRFRAQRPGAELELHEITVFGLQRPWQSGRYDFVVISELDDTPPPADDPPRHALFTSPLVVTARQGHPLARAGSLRELHHSTWILPGYGPALLARLLQPLGLDTPNDIILCQSLQFSVSVLRGSDTLSLYSAALHRDAVMSNSLITIAVKEALPSLRVSLVVRDETLLTPAARTFMSCLMEVSRAIETGRP